MIFSFSEHFCRELIGNQPSYQPLDFVWNESQETFTISIKLSVAFNFSCGPLKVSDQQIGYTTFFDFFDLLQTI
jgi:hypothetical protein